MLYQAKWARKFARFLGLAMVVAFFAPFPNPATGKVIERVIVVVDGEPFTLSDMQAYARTQIGRELDTQNLPDMSEPEKIILEQFITDKLIAAEVARLSIRIVEEDIDKYIEVIKKKSRISDDQLVEALARQGMDLKRYRATIRSEIEKRELIKRQVEGKVNITPGDVERYYRTNDTRFMTKGKIHLRHILLQIAGDASPEQEKITLARANEIRQRALQGETFHQLARQYSEGAGASKGGDIGWVDRQSLMIEIAKEAFNLPVQEISLPVRTSLGIHLLKVEEHRPARPIPLSQVEGRIKNELYSKAMEERFQRWLKTDLRSNHRVDIKLAGFIFRAEEIKEGTVDSLMASASPAMEEKERGLMSYLNPFSYIISETPLEDESGNVIADYKKVSLFGIPLFTTESVDDLEEEPFIQGRGPEGKAEPVEPKGFFSKALDSINPF